MGVKAESEWLVASRTPRTLGPPMSTLVAAAPLYLSISTGLFSLYLFFSSAYRSLGSRRLAAFCLLIPFLLVIDSVVALVILGSEDPSLDLVHTEYVLLVLVRLALNLMTALLLHPHTLSHFLGRPALKYTLQAKWVWTIGVIAISASIIDTVASFLAIFSPMTFLLGALVSPLTFALLIRVAMVNRKWNSSSSKFCWYLLATLQLPALTVSILRAWPGNAAASTACHFCLLVWTTGTLISVSNISPFTPSKSPKQHHLAPRRISHTTVSEDFQANHDPFAGPLALGMDHQRRYHLPFIPSSAAYADTYDELDDRSSQGKRAIRTQYSSESSTRWLLSHPHVESLPSLPPPVHLEPPARVKPRILTSVECTIGLPDQVTPDSTAGLVVSRDRTPTQSLYIPLEDPLRNLPGESSEGLFTPQPETGSLPSIPSFELDTPDQTFSSEVETSIDTNESASSVASVDEELLTMPMSSDGDADRDKPQGYEPSPQQH